MKLYSYIVTHDTGFSPNPFWGCCTLANCKPTIRRTATVGDWIAGLSPKVDGNRVIFAMKIGEILPYAMYFRDERFLNKKPDYFKKETVWRRGDNIYEPLPNGEFRQLRSRHSNGVAECPETKDHDLRGSNVLVSKQFYYFGTRSRGLPGDLSELKVGRAHKNRFSREVISRFIQFITAQPQGVNGPPVTWPSDDRSWELGQL